MKTFIIDNGEDYSAHTIYLLETDLDPALIEKLVSLVDGGRYSIIAVSENTKWRLPDERCSLADLFAPYEMKDKAWASLTRAEIEALLPSWEEWVKRYTGHIETLAKIKARLAAMAPVPEAP